ncbi:hypothetical protein HBB16_03045 [Pseudonocardia sp. MCCB 268]|nr:hypothetical protein [Pseudonocardia cytotoxica]
MVASVDAAAWLGSGRGGLGPLGDPAAARGPGRGRRARVRRACGAGFIHGLAGAA